MKNKRYRRSGYPVPRASRAEVRLAAHNLRDWVQEQFGWTDDPFPCVRLIEVLGASLNGPNYEEVLDNSLPGTDALWDPHEKSFRIRETVWDLADAGDPGARETLAHEIGHWALGHPPAAFYRRYDNGIVVPEEDSEHQADWFLEELLVDSRRISKADGIDTIQRRFGVSVDLAVERIRRVVVNSRSV